MRELKQTIAAAIGRGDFVAASAGCETMMQSGESGDGLHLQGILRLAQGDREAAVALLQRAHALCPERADIAYDHGVALVTAGRVVDAVTAWRVAVALSADHVAAWRNLALAVGRSAGDDAAAEIYRQALEHHPQDRELLYNYGNLCFRRGDLAAAAAMQARVLAVHPAFAAGWINAGMTHKAAGRFDAAEDCYRRAIALGDPTNLALAHFNLANLLLQQGRWAEGFLEYEWRRRLPNALAPPWPAPPWTAARPPGGSVLVWNDQGVGDAIQFLRFTARLAERGDRVVVLVQESLKALAASAPGVAAAFGPGDMPHPVDAQAPLCSLPHLLAAAPAASGSGPYLHACRPVPLPDRAVATGPRVGLVWAGNPTHANDANRSMRLADLAPLLALPEPAWFSLQLGSGPAELAASPWAGRLRDLSPLLTDFAATAAVLSQLDLLICVDTAAAHLAGALARPVWILLPAVGTDWRWATAGTSTAWYPSARLFRQRQAGAWAPVVAEIAALLAAKRGHSDMPAAF